MQSDAAMTETLTDSTTHQTKPTDINVLPRIVRKHMMGYTWRVPSTDDKPLRMLNLER